MVRTRTKRLSLILQRLALYRMFPESNLYINKNELVWEGELTPSIMSCTYRVELRYRLEYPPTVRVLDPPLETREGEQIPHLYPDGRLCLYYPKAREWNSSKHLSDTIVPWASEWLFFYEIWLATGTWTGGGVHGGEFH